MPMVEFSAVLDSDEGHAWGVLKKFGEIHKWHPSIVESSIEDNQPDGLVGCIRKLTLADGAVVRERLLSVDDRNTTLSYRFEEAPLPLDNYVATVKLAALTGQSKTFVHWSASFDLQDLKTAEQYQELIGGLIVDGHNSLQLFLTQR
ncbi:polyketide cyclase [Pseudomonas frederiksbergensis]|uniref:Polyketide cyclase n=1 Tax=Pseudomonas frederiksbergensis TaxID=104087 RepID=A0A423KH90_9PSED|nr:SRPBCC family protein [Pseudomonas frederiksbergensis]RON52454.1 polyketide cyclase [Pseudomonas frederiksbergensis]